MKQITYEYLKENNCILYECIVGSQAYATNVETSDIDKKFVYILPEDCILGTGYIEQINVNKDYVGWEIRRFLELMGSNNPTVLELLNSPEDCIVSKHPLFDLIISHKDEFITKICKDSFGGYARQQISKAKGLNKKQNWEKDKVTRKDVLDFCYVIEGHKSIPMKVFLNNYYDQKFCGVVNIPNARDMYALYYDDEAHRCFHPLLSEKSKVERKEYLLSKGRAFGFGFKGITKKGEGANVAESNQLRLSSIPKVDQLGHEVKPIAIFTYNKDGYSSHCKDYKEYQEWLENRNETRYVETKEHGQRIDGKNMMHCIRLIRMAQEIGAGKGINVRRSDAEELLSIRRGEVDLDNLIQMADQAIEEMDSIFDNSDLPKKVDSGLVNSLLIKIRKDFYSRS
jgi:predicted nucleotidyltransferase